MDSGLEYHLEYQSVAMVGMLGERLDSELLIRLLIDSLMMVDRLIDRV